MKRECHICGRDGEHLFRGAWVCGGPICFSATIILDAEDEKVPQLIADETSWLVLSRALDVEVRKQRRAEVINALENRMKAINLGA